MATCTPTSLENCVRQTFPSLAFSEAVGRKMTQNDNAGEQDVLQPRSLYNRSFLFSK